MAKELAVLGIDLGKNSCSLAGLDASGAVVKRRRMRPDSVTVFTAKIPACVIAMEACCGAHYLGRLLAAQGHTVRLMSPEYVRPYVKAQKNDDRDAEAIAEAATRPTMRFVELKSEEQLDLQTLHRARDRLVGERTALINQLRAILLERGITVPKGRRKLEHYLVARFDQNDEDSIALTPRMQALIGDMRDEWRELDHRIGAFDDEFVARARDDEAACRLLSIPGIGPDQRHRTDRCDRQGRDVFAGSGSRGLAGVGTASDHDGRAAPACRDQQARQQISAQAVDPWRALRPARSADQCYTTGRLAAGVDGQGAQERRGRRIGQQAGADCVGRPTPRRQI